MLAFLVEYPLLRWLLLGALIAALLVPAWYLLRLAWAWATLPWAILRRLDDLIDQRRG